jgi:protein translocase SecG subunit
MQNFLIIVLTSADVFIALMLIVMVLVQHSKDSALGSAFGGMGESVFGAHATGHLTKLTIILAILFLSLTLILAIVIGHRSAPTTIIDKIESIERQENNTKSSVTEQPATVEEKKSSGTEKPQNNMPQPKDQEGTSPKAANSKTE